MSIWMARAKDLFGGMLWSALLIGIPCGLIAGFVFLIATLLPSAVGWNIVFWAPFVLVGLAFVLVPAQVNKSGRYLQAKRYWAASGVWSVYLIAGVTWLALYL